MKVAIIDITQLTSKLPVRKPQLNLYFKHYVCHPSFTNTKLFCCLAELHCSSGVTSSSIKYCKQLSGCQSNEECEEILNMDGNFIIKYISAARNSSKNNTLLRSGTFLTDVIRASCTSRANCLDDYEYSNLAATNEYACCKGKKKLMQICPDNRFICCSPTVFVQVQKMAQIKPNEKIVRFDKKLLQTVSDDLTIYNYARIA
uniref:Uncharacterized protein n=1 Tax=Onchocerca volvulus TaxID=6282 RepID=A0A8R1XPU3_ONCVO